MPTFGLLDTGFNPKRFTDVQSAIVAGIRSVPGLSRLNLGRETFLGGAVAAISEAVAEMWEVAAELYAAGDPDTATGRALDNLCAITGTVRKGPTPTRVACTVNLDVGTYPAGSLIANPVGRADLQYTNVATLVRVGSTGNVAAIFIAVFGAGRRYCSPHHSHLAHRVVIPLFKSLFGSFLCFDCGDLHRCVAQSTSRSRRCLPCRCSG